MYGSYWNLSSTTNGSNGISPPINPTNRHELAAQALVNYGSNSSGNNSPNQQQNGWSSPLTSLNAINNTKYVPFMTNQVVF